MIILLAENESRVEIRVKKRKQHRELCDIFPVQPTEGSRGFLAGAP
jgi:hypothetical protein